MQTCAAADRPLRRCRGTRPVAPRSAGVPARPVSPRHAAARLLARAPGHGALLLLSLAVLSTLLPGRPVAARAPGASPPVGCPARVALLGANLSVAGRAEVRRALGVDKATLEIVETVADARVQAHGLVPAGLLGYVAVSSALLQRRPPGAGLSVTINPGITLNTAQSYAGALLTAGIYDADVYVAAPISQAALGTTALLSLLRAATTSCIPLRPARRDLAIRQIVLSEQLAGVIGRDAAAGLVFDLALRATKQSVAALPGLVDRAVAARGLTIPLASRTLLLAFLRDLALSDVYGHLPIGAAGGASGQFVVHLAAASRSPAPAAARVVYHSLAGVWRGVVMEASNSTLRARLRGGPRSFRLGPASPVIRNGQSVGLGNLRPGDAVTVTTDAAGVAALVEADGVNAPAASAVVAPAAPAPDAPWLLVVAWFALLALLLYPVLTALRRRQAMATPLSGSGPRRMPRYVPKGTGRAPFKSKGSGGIPPQTTT